MKSLPASSMEGAVVQTDTPDATPVQRLYSLREGYYWRAKRDLKRWKTKAGVCRLLVEIGFVMGKPHSVKLREHPSIGEGYDEILLDAFLDGFEPEHDGEEIRQREVEEIQKRVAVAQEELIQGQSNPTIIEQEIAEKMAIWEKSHGGLSLSAGHTLTPASDMATLTKMRVSQADVSAMRTLAEREAFRAGLISSWLSERTAAITETLNGMMPFFKEKAAVAIARTKKAQRIADEFLRDISTLDLYTGKGVQIETLVKGKSAPSEEKLHIFQRKLFADEELSAWAPLDAEDIDASKIEWFDETFVKEATLREQILPRPRGVVAMACNRREKNYEYGGRDKNEENRKVWLLVRDGENFYRIVSPITSHQHTPRLFPRTEDFGRLFRGADGRTVTTADVELGRRDADRVAFELHYKRFLVLLAGLDHRERLFGEFYPAEESDDFLTQAFQSRRFAFVHDDEPSQALTDGKLPLDAWKEAKNAFLQSGSRVFCHFDNILSPAAAPSCRKQVYSQNAPGVVVLAEPISEKAGEVFIAKRDGLEYFVEIRVQREYQRWQNSGPRAEFNARVALRPGEHGFAYLCLDAVEPEEILHYVRDRDARVDFVEYMRLFKQIAAVLQAEREAEAPARDYLESALALLGVSDPRERRDIVCESIRHWRAGRLGRPLPLLEDKAGLNSVLSLAHSRFKARDGIAERAQAWAAEKGLKPLRIVVSGRNRIGLYAEVPEGERVIVLGPWDWVYRVNLQPGKTTLIELGRRLQRLVSGDKQNAKEEILWEDPNAVRSWSQEEGISFRPSQLSEAFPLVEKAFEGAMGTFRPLGSGFEPNVWPNLLRDGLSRFKASGSRKCNGTVWIDVPIGLRRAVTFEGWHSKRKRDVLQAVTITEEWETWFWRFANPEQRAELERAYCANFRNPVHAKQSLAWWAPRIELRELPTEAGLSWFTSLARGCDSLDHVRIQDEDRKIGRSPVLSLPLKKWNPAEGEYLCILPDLLTGGTAAHRWLLDAEVMSDPDIAEALVRQKASQAAFGD